MKKPLKRILSLALAVVMLAALAPTMTFAAETEGTSFKQKLEEQYKDPDRVFSTEVRWWLGDAAHTDETLLEELQALYDAGFRGVELCMQDEPSADNATYAYGSRMWSHKWKLMMNKLLDLGMTVSLTSGTNWSTSNVPQSYLDPASQAAMQIVTLPTYKTYRYGPITEEELLSESPPSRLGNAWSRVSRSLGISWDQLRQDPSLLDYVNNSSAAASANIGVSQGPIIIGSGETVSGPVQKSKQRDNSALLAVYAYKYNEATKSFVYGSEIDLMAAGAVTRNGNSNVDYTINWTAPNDGEYDGKWFVTPLWTQGSYQTSSPGAENCFATNYFDLRGLEALKTFWEDNILNDPELNAKIKEGDVQLFMDSLEISVDGGLTFWAEDMAEQFQARKGYDITPYLILISGIDQSNGQLVRNPYYPTKGTYDLENNADLREKILNDYFDVLTNLYMERMLIPMKEWLNTYGIKTRAQITYGRTFDISEPIMAVDYPEAEAFNQYNQVDIYRLWTGGSKLQNKVLSSETSTLNNMANGYSKQLHLRDAYAQYAAGFQRIIWHIWTSAYGYGAGREWPGYYSGQSYVKIFNRLGTREPSYRDYDEMNAHLGRVQELMQTGESRTDIGFIHNNWVQGIRYGGGTGNNITGMNWQLAHMGVYYRSTELQDNGYTYDYFSPEFLYADGVSFNEETKTIEQAGYKAVVLYQDWLDVKGAERILEWAKKGLKVVILEGAARMTPFDDGQDARLAEIMAELKTLSTVRVAKIYDADENFDYADPVAQGYDDGVYEALQELGVRPYAEYIEPNHQLLTQTRQDEDGNLYLYAYNYCDNEYHKNSYIDSVKTEDHGTVISTEIKMDGEFIPYVIDAWTGSVTELANYRYENGQTVFDIELDYDNIALFAFEKVDSEKLHSVESNAEFVYNNGENMVFRATESGDCYAVLSDGSRVDYSFDVPEPYDITDWDVTVESWTANPVKGDLTRSETLFGVETMESKTSTVKTDINVKLDTLTTWDYIPEVGRNVSGLARYEATFKWDAKKADGAYLDFGADFSESMKVWINGVKVGGGVTANDTKVPRSIVEGYDGAVETTGGINWMTPVADISDYLVDGTNTIVIEYSGDLTNQLIYTKAISARQNVGGWWGYNIDYRSYGPAQAVIIPFVEEQVSTADSAIYIPSRTNVDSAFPSTVRIPATYTGEDLSSVRLKIDSALPIAAIESENDFEYNPATGMLIVYTADGTALPRDLFTIVYEIDSIVDEGCYPIDLTVIQGTGAESEVAAVDTGAVDGMIIVDNTYFNGDVNRDGSVTNADLIMIARYLVQLVEFDDEQKELADYNDDGVIDNKDLVLIARALVEA